MGVPQTATPDEIKKAYRKLALLKHPDKCPGVENAAENFQKLQKAYQILSDPKKRQKYDQYGDEGEGEDGVYSTDDWLSAYEYFRTIHPELQKKDISGYAERYRFSDEEQRDLIKFYE